MPVISEDDRDFFERNGYVKVEGAVPDENCDAVVDAIWEFMGKDPDDRETWYTPPEGTDDYWGHQGGGMVEMYQHQSMWDNRQHPAVYQAFAELLGEEALWVSEDRVNFTPPSREEHPELDQEFVHWDVDTSPLPDLPVLGWGTERVPFGLQGVLYLDDTSAEQGGFQCVPDLYRNLDEWVADQPDDRDPRSPEFGDEYEIEAVPGEKGDLVLWNRLLPHGNGRNRSDEPRFAQYILMTPESFADAETRRQRVHNWRHGEGPDWQPGDPRGREQGTEPAELTGLGEKLLGLDPWPGWLDD